MPENERCKITKKGKFIKTIIIVNQCQKYKHLITKTKSNFCSN